MNQSSPSLVRLPWLDLARFTAIISVVANHAMSRSFSISKNTYNEFISMGLATSFLKAFVYVFSRIGVPLFLMITGSLLLGRDFEDKRVFNRFLKKNWFPLLRTSMIWLGIMYWYLQLFSGSILKTEGLIRAIKLFIETVCFVNVKSMSSMWYMYMILCVYLMIPIISLSLKKLGDKYVFFLFLTVVVIGMVFPNFNTFLLSLGSSRKYIPALSISDFFSIYFLYILSGWWISQRKLERLPGYALLCCMFGVFLLTTVFQLWIYQSGNTNYFVRYADIGILSSAALVFECFRRYSLKTTSKWFTPVLYISKISFGIYFIHICIMTALKVFLDRYSSLWGFPRFLFLFIFSFIGSVILIKATQSIHFFRKYLFIIKE